MPFAICHLPLLAALTLLALTGCRTAQLAAPETGAAGRANHFLVLTNFSEFIREADPSGDGVVLTSPIIRSPAPWTESIVSWNAALGAGAWLEMEAAPVEGTSAHRFYSFGTWSLDCESPPRTSIRGQRDARGVMRTDTLVLTEPADAVRLRIKLGGGATVEDLRFVSLNFHRERQGGVSPEPNRRAWGRVLEVPERSQMNYPDGNRICSPTTVSMMLAYWAARLNRPDLDVDVPAVCEGTYDPGWGGWGNWIFNMAYAGSLPGLRAYATRLDHVEDLEDWIAAGIPVGLSLCYNKLRGRSGPASGHLVVCVGFTETGEVVFNDGGTRKNIRKVFSREAVARAWSHSKNTVYLIHPVDAVTPLL